ncbi:MAG: hypothetical protein R3B49_10610 [Phycisphaerales bacterium]
MPRTMLIAGLALSGAVSAASAGVYLDHTGWIDAIPGATLHAPDFGAFGPTSFQPNTFTNLGGYFYLYMQGGSVGDATLETDGTFVFDFSPGGLRGVYFEFFGGIRGFGATWSNTAYDVGVSVDFVMTRYDLNAIALPLDDQFVGIIDPMSGADVLAFLPTEIGGDDTLVIRDFEFITGPAPSTAVLLALGALAGIRRRR